MTDCPHCGSASSGLDGLWHCGTAANVAGAIRTTTCQLRECRAKLAEANDRLAKHTCPTCQSTFMGVDCPRCETDEMAVRRTAAEDALVEVEKELKHVHEKQGELRQDLTDCVSELERERRIGTTSWATLTTLCTELAEGVRSGLPDGTDIDESVGRWIGDLIKSEVDVVDLAYAKLRRELTDAKAALGKMSHRKCRECGNVAYHLMDILPHVLCEKCGSQDTRLIREAAKAAGGDDGNDTV